MKKAVTTEKEYIPSALPGMSPVMPHSIGNGYFGRGSPESNVMARGTSWTDSRNRSGEVLGDWKGR